MKLYAESKKTLIYGFQSFQIYQEVRGNYIQGVRKNGWIFFLVNFYGSNWGHKITDFVFLAFI